MDLERLPNIKGKPIEKRPGVAKCPIHGCMGMETTWKPQGGLNPKMREYECGFIGKSHAFYVVHAR